MWFGPPRRLTAASSCPWIGHPVSGLLYATIRPLQTRSPSGSGALHLNLAAYSNSPARSTKSTRSLSLPLLVNIGFQVLFHSPPGVLFTFPSQYWFTIGHYRVFSLSEWSPILPTRFHVSRRTQDPANSIFTSIYGAFTLSSLPFQIIHLSFIVSLPSPNPEPINQLGLGCSPFARHY